MKLDPVDLWLSKVEKRHSGSETTAKIYSAHLERFCTFLETTPNKILEEWKRVKYDLRGRDQYIDDMLEKVDLFEHYLGKEGLCNNSVSTYISSLQSFFKYMRIPVKIETFTARPEYHNRDITRIEIQKVLNDSKPRDKAFFLMMLQSGLRPMTLIQLTYAQIKTDFEAERTPCLIDVPRSMTKGEYKEHFTFIGPEAVNALKMYFAKEKRTLTSTMKLFNGPRTVNAYSMRFGYYVRELELIKPENLRVNKEGKLKRVPQQLRLYCLRKYFRKMASPAGPDFVNFWMGHTLGVDDHYFSRDPEYHRKVYAEKAMPNLRIFEHTSLDVDKIISQQTEEIEDLKARLKSIEQFTGFDHTEKGNWGYAQIHTETYKLFQKLGVKDFNEWLCKKLLEDADKKRQSHSEA